MKCSCKDSNRKDKQHGIQCPSKLPEEFMKAREIRKRLRAGEHHERKSYAAKINRAFTKLSEGCSLNVRRSVSLAPDWRIKPEADPVYSENPKYQKVCNEAGRTIHAVQKKRGRSQIPKGVI